MKTLKYIAFLGLAGLLLGSCQKEQGLNDQNKGKDKPVVTLTKGVATDGELTFTIAADASASQYGYVIFSGTDNAAPTPYEIVVDEVSGADASEVFSYADGASTEVTLECDSNADYQIFAAAITETGLVGEVTSLNIFVTDTVNPEIVFDEDNGFAFECQESILAIQYTEPIKYVESKEITATLYAGYHYADDNVSIYPGVEFDVYPYIVSSATPVGTAKAKVSVSGDVLIMNFGTMTPGTVYTISIPDGAIVDAAGNEAEGYNESFTYPYFFRGEPAFEWIIYGSTSNAPLTVTMPEQTTIEDLGAWIKVGVPSMVQRIDSKAEFTTTIKHVEEKDGVKSETVTTYPMAHVTNFGDDYYNILVKPAGEPKPKDMITITIPKGACTDIYGNVNDEIVLGPFKYAYTPVYPKEGVYTVTSVLGTTFPMQLVATSKDDPEAPYLLYGYWFGLFGGYHNPILYLTVNEEARTLTCDGGFVYKNNIYDSGLWGSSFYYCPGTDNQYYFSVWGGGSSGTEPVVFNYGDDGYINTMSYFEYGVSAVSNNAYMGAYDYVDDNSPVSALEQTASAAQPESALTLVPADFSIRNSVRK